MACVTSVNNVLDPGEASCLVLAISRNLIFVTDDLAARQAAKANEVLLTGTLGILIRLIRDHVISLDEANCLLALMIQQGYRSLVDCLDSVI